MSKMSPSPSRFSRRDFLHTAATLAPNVSALIASTGEAATAGERVPPTCLHVFAKPFESLSYADTAALVADGGYGGIDFTVRPRGHVLPERVEDDLPRAVEAAVRRGLKVEMITTGIIDPRAPETARILRTAARLGVRYYRLGVFAYEANLPVWDALLKQKPVFRELAELGRTHGLHGAVQNHSGARVSSAVWDLFELFRDLDPRWIGCQYDVRHAVVEGALSWPLGMKLLAPWIRTTDLKDFVWQQSGGRATPVNVPLGEGVVRYEEYFRLVRDLKIAGPISVHFEYGPFERSAQPLTDPVRRSAVVQALRKDLATLQGWLRRHQLS